jgi:hypothetical protein
MYTTSCAKLLMWSALHWAALEGQVEPAAALLDSGAKATSIGGD